MELVIGILLGILLGIASCVAYGAYLSERQRKINIEHQKRLFEYLFPFQSLEKQLQDAIDREDFKEAARLRDLMNKA